MAPYTVMNELQSIEFHDTFLQHAYMNASQLHMIFSDAIIMGHSCPERNGHIPCSVNKGEDRYARPQLEVTFQGFCIHEILRGGCWTWDAAGNSVEKYSPRKLRPDEYDAFLKMVLSEKNQQIQDLHYDEAAKTYTLCFIMNADGNYYEMAFTAASAIAQFAELGEDAWYLDRYRKMHQKG